MISESIIDTETYCNCTQEGEPCNFHLFPTTAYDHLRRSNTSITPAIGWTQIIRELFCGVHDEACILNRLRGQEDTLVRYISTFMDTEYLKNVTLTVPARQVGKVWGGRIIRFNHPRPYATWDTICEKEKGEKEEDDEEDESNPSTYPNDYVAWTRCGQLEFPPPNGRNVNMMPFIFGDVNSLPEDLKCYHECIMKCPMQDSNGVEATGKVCYLTVHESFVNPQEIQRRGGLHIEAPGTTFSKAPGFDPATEHHWGIGHYYDTDKFHGGIFMASSVANTSRLFNAVVDNSVPGIVDAHGGCEYLRRCLGQEGTELEANELIWMTDRTIHEAIPQETAGIRQFFRLVGPDISHWFAEHSTLNPLVSLPKDIIIVEEDKFSGTSYIEKIKKIGSSVSELSLK